MFFAFTAFVFTKCLVKNFKWSFEVTSDKISFESPYFPRRSGTFNLKDIEKIDIHDGDTIHARIILKNGNHAIVPGTCLTQVESIIKEMRQVNVPVFINGREK